MSKKIFVGNLSFEVTDLDLEDLFKQHGEVLSAKVILDRDTSRSRGFGFVEMNSDSSAQAAIDALNGTEVKGRAVNVSLAKERTDDRRGGGGFRSSGGFKRRRDY
jgi:RNA recognition motif-containing protein